MAIDTYRHKGMRKRLAELVQLKGIEDERVLAAIAKVPRHVFLDEAFVEKAYEDVAFPIAEEQTISQPFTVAYQTQLLQPQASDCVLEISNYQPSIVDSEDVGLSNSPRCGIDNLKREREGLPTDRNSEKQTEDEYEEKDFSGHWSPPCKEKRRIP